MGRHVSGDGWSLVLPQGVTGGPLEHSHAHLRAMTLYRGTADDGSELEVIVTTYAGDPIGENGQPLDRDGGRWAVPGARTATRRDQLTRLEIDPGAAPVQSVVLVATGLEGGSACLVVHRPIGSPTGPAEAVIASFALTQP